MFEQSNTFVKNLNDTYIIFVFIIPWSLTVHLQTHETQMYFLGIASVYQCCMFSAVLDQRALDWF